MDGQIAFANLNKGQIYKTALIIVYFTSSGCFCPNISTLLTYATRCTVYVLCSSDLVLSDCGGRQVLLLNEKCDGLQINLCTGGALTNPPSGSCPSSKNFSENTYEHHVILYLCYVRISFLFYVASRN